MKSAIAVSLALGATLVAAAPSSGSNIRAIINKRAAASNYTDADILQYALTLEHLESAFYGEALGNLTAADFTAAGLPNTTYAEMKQIREHEAQHVTLLSGGLTAAGATPVQACTYKFPYKGVKEFLALSQIIEGVGVAAYLGAAQFIASPQYVTIAGSILTTEARHNTFVRTLNGEDPFATPEDTPQSPREVVSMVGGFFVSCPDGSAPTIKPFPALTAPTGNVSAGTMAKFTVAEGAAANSTSLTFCGFANGLTPVFTPYTAESGCKIPSGLAGQGYVVLTSSNATITDDTVLAGPAIVDFGSSIPTNGTATATGSSSGSTGSTNKTAAADTKSGGAASVIALGGSSKMAAVGAFVLGAVALVL